MCIRDRLEQNLIRGTRFRTSRLSRIVIVGFACYVWTQYVCIVYLALRLDHPLLEQNLIRATRFRTSRLSRTVIVGFARDFWTQYVCIVHLALRLDHPL